MFTDDVKEAKQLESARKFFGYIADTLDAGISVRLWDGTMIPLGKHVEAKHFLAINDKGVLGSIARKPTPENIAREYATGSISIHGGDIIDFVNAAREKISKKDLRSLKKGKLLRLAAPFLFIPSKNTRIEHEYSDDVTGRKQSQRNNKQFIQFHYDVSNEFYQLFLDPEMQYSCGYFTDWNNSLAQAQQDKLNMICKKLRLKAGEKMLDIGCGWGGLICHAAKNYGVKAHGVTLSQTQHDFTKEKIERLGLKDKVTVELRDYSELTGTYDKISSIGMFEHIGITNFQTYFNKVNSLLPDRGIILNHSITCRAKKKRLFRGNRISTEKRLLLRHIFPGSELADVGTMTQAMERCGLEVRDVEAWREHYGKTSEFWCKNLTANREKAIELIGLEKYNMWVLYLAGVSLGFTAGSMHICQVVGVKNEKKGNSNLPPTREYLYSNKSLPLFHRDPL